jgi:hypothetical protein
MLPDGLNPGVQKTNQVATLGLLVALSARVEKTAIETSKQGVLDNPSDARIVSTRALKEYIDGVPAYTTLIDDTATSTDKSWSASKIISWVAENDDSEFFADIDARDAYTVTPERNGLSATVYNASADPDVGFNSKGEPLGAVYIRKDGAWELLQAIGGKDIVLAGYLHEDALVQDYITNDPKKAISSAVAVALATLAQTAQADVNNTVLQPVFGDIVWDADNSENRVELTFKPKGQIVNFEVSVVDASGTHTPYVGEIVDENGVGVLKISMETPADLSANKALFTYMHNGKANA